MCIINIFILDEDKALSVVYHPDKHIVKMPVEGTQLLCSVLHKTGQARDWMYKPSHMNHPCSLWASKSLSNWLWLQDYVVLMGKEYTYRYNKYHKSAELAAVLDKPNIPDFGLTPFAKVVPEEFKNLPVIDAYRNYFIEYKRHLKKYTNRSVPCWWKNNMPS